ncbi:MAG: pilus assembly protein N-terminal domain-containing protein [Alphaproteobacteria bacterium]|nr:pilus assembly protein N-terminal domain-containing protein [Alphaproteobacteria bacterium]MDE2337584.1 pilus assembly protein N-terminal domain-containing protein [Alphaproteobacteria bacterium]
MKRILLKGLLVLMLVTAGMSVSDTARSAPSYNKTVRLIAGKASTVGLLGNVSDILVADPAVADVGTLRANRIYIVGKKVGDTNVLVYDAVGNQLANITVHVRMDDKSLQDALRQFFPQEKVRAQTVQSNIVLSGVVSSPEVANRVRDLASRFLTGQGQTLVDLMKVGGEEQVMLKVKVLEADRSVLKEYGVQTSFHGGDLKLAGNDVGRVSGQTAFATGSIIAGGGLANFVSNISALESHGLVNTLAEPNLTAISGETAGFLAGGEFPVPTSKDSQGNVVLTFKQFGVSLNFTPTVLSEDRIAMELSTEVSDKDESNAVTLQGITIPGLSVRRADTTVEMGSGSSIMIAGLLKSDTLHALNGMPGVEDLPIIGQLFKSKSFARNESELVIIVTPYLVKPYAAPEAVAVSPPAPPLLPGSSGPAPHGVPLTVAAAKMDEHPPVAAAPVADVQATSVGDNGVTPLTQSFVGNMRKIYGSRAMEKVGTGAGFGYIVE